MKQNDNIFSEDEEKLLKEIDRSLSEQVNLALDDNDHGKRKRHIKHKKIIISLSILFGVIILSGAFIAFTPAGHRLLIRMAGNYIYNKLEVDKKPAGKEVIARPRKSSAVEKQDDIKRNILLLGVEEFYGASNTDCIIVATIDTKNKTLKLTSLMRDLYVDIPGHDNNRLNAVYSLGGIDLLYQTLENDFGIYADGYILVNFDTLEYIVDKLDGIEITLTREEADYLNTTNYISNPRNRNVVEGTQIMNGNQALGYSRVRKVSTGTENNDFGRTQRERIVLNSIFKKVKKLNVLQLTVFMNNVLINTDVTTDIPRNDFNDYLEQAVTIMKNIKINEYRVPEDGAFENRNMLIGKKKRAVLIPKDWDEVRENIRQYINGSTTE